METFVVEVSHTLSNPTLDVSQFVIEVERMTGNVAVTVPFGIFAFVGTCRFELCQLLAEAVEDALCGEIALAQVAIAHAHFVVEVASVRISQPAEDVKVAVLVSCDVFGIVLVGFHDSRVEIVVAPSLSYNSIKIPDGEGDAWRHLFVVAGKEHVLAMIVCGQDGFEQNVVVDDERQVKPLAHLLAELLIAGRANEVDSVVERLPVCGTDVFYVGIFHLVFVPHVAVVVETGR